jgi:hypothetical protein
LNSHQSQSPVQKYYWKGGCTMSGKSLERTRNQNETSGK